MTDLPAQLDHAVDLPLLDPVAVWRAAAVLGGLRTGVNDRQRASDRDRGAEGNMLADLGGGFAELVGLRHLERAGVRDLVGRLLDPCRPVDEVDLAGTLSGAPVRIEVKAHLAHPAKRLLLVNTRALQRSVRRGAHGFLPVLAHTGHDAARVGRVIPVEDVGAWPVRVLGRHQDPAHALRLTEVGERYLGGRLYPRSHRVVEEPLLWAAYQAGRAAGARGAVPTLDLSGTSAGALVRRLVAVLDGEGR